MSGDSDGHAYVLGPDRRGRCAYVSDGLWRWWGVGEPPGLPTAERLACADAVIQPGWVNAHTHLYSGLLPYGVAVPAPTPADFLSILRQLWWRLDRALDHALLAAAAEVAIADALLAGTTTLCDHHESPNSIAGSLHVLADACAKLGVRALLTYGVTERNGGLAEAEAGLQACRDIALRAQTPLLRSYVGLHAGFTVSDGTLRRVGDLARQMGVPVHAHVAEAAADVAFACQRGDVGALARFERCGALPANSLLAHGVHATAHEVALATLRRSWWVQNPRSNVGNRVGYPVQLARSRRVALGTDGYPATMMVEVAGAKAAGAAHGEPPQLALQRLRNGWQLAGERFGVRLGPWTARRGAVQADIAAVGSAGAVHVLVGGRPVVRDGQLVHADLHKIRATAATAASELNRRMCAIVTEQP